MQFTDKDRPRSACANAQVEQDLHCLLTESMDIVEHVDKKRMSIPGVMDLHAHLDVRCSQMAKMPFSHVAHYVLMCHKDHSFKIMVCSPHDTRDHHVAINFAIVYFNHMSRNIRTRTFVYVSSEESDQPVYFRSLIRIFTGCSLVC